MTSPLLPSSLSLSVGTLRSKWQLAKSATSPWRPVIRTDIYNRPFPPLLPPPLPPHLSKSCHSMPPLSQIPRLLSHHLLPAPPSRCSPVRPHPPSRCLPRLSTRLPGRRHPSKTLSIITRRSVRDVCFVTSMIVEATMSLGTYRLLLLCSSSVTSLLNIRVSTNPLFFLSFSLSFSPLFSLASFLLSSNVFSQAVCSDAVTVILSFCSAPTLTVCSAVSRLWRKLAVSDELWGNLCRKEFGVCPDAMKPSPDPVKKLFIMTHKSLLVSERGRRRRVEEKEEGRDERFRALFLSTRSSLLFRVVTNKQHNLSPSLRPAEREEEHLGQRDRQSCRPLPFRSGTTGLFGSASF